MGDVAAVGTNVKILMSIPYDTSWITNSYSGCHYHKFKGDQFFGELVSDRQPETYLFKVGFRFH